MTTLELVSSGVVDLQDNIPISLNYSIADIREPQKRSAPFSKTIKLPGTDNNNDLFKHIYEINSYSSFNPKVKAKVVISEDGIPVLVGNMQLKSVSITDGNIEYSVVVVGESGGFFQAIEGQELTDLDFTEFDHTLEYDNLLDTWLSSVYGAGYVYPLFDDGKNNGLSWPITSFAPAIYVKEYVDKIFSAAGWTYTSTFIDSDYFKRLIIPYSGGKAKLDDAAMLDRTFEVTNSADITWTFKSGNQIVFDTETSDPGNDITGGVFTVPATGVYKFSFNLTVSYKDRLTLEINRDGIQYLYYYREFGTKTSQPYTITTNEVNLIKNQQVWVNVAGGDSNTTSNSVTLHAASTFSGISINSGVAEGDTMVVNNTIPENIKQRDFIMSIFKAHNLYVEQDPDKSNNLLIETRNDYYSDDVVDWSEFVDYSQPIEIKPLGDLSGRRYLFSYKADTDYYNKDYTNTYDEIYGQKLYSTDNEFLVNDIKTELIFSPTVMIGDREGIYPNGIFRFVYPSLSNVAYMDEGASPKSANIRLLYWGGLKGSPYWDVSTDSGSIAAPSALGAYFYPYAGHLDDVNTPTIDLSFGPPRSLYYNTESYTNNNLCNAYYKQFIEEITDKDSKVVSFPVLLDAVKVSNLDFRKKYRIGDSLYRLNKVTNYNPVEPNICRVEMLLIRGVAEFTGSTTTSNGGIDTEL